MKRSFHNFSVRINTSALLKHIINGFYDPRHLVIEQSVMIKESTNDSPQPLANTCTDTSMRLSTHAHHSDYY